MGLEIQSRISHTVLPSFRSEQCKPSLTDCEHCHHAHLIPAFLSVSHDMLQCAAQEDMSSVHLQPQHRTLQQQLTEKLGEGCMEVVIKSL